VSNLYNKFFYSYCNFLTVSAGIVVRFRLVAGLVFITDHLVVQLKQSISVCVSVCPNKNFGTKLPLT